MEDFLRVGVVTTTHGVRGEMKVYPTTDDPKRFLDLEKVFIDEPEGPKGTKEQPGKGSKAPVKTVRRERAVEGVKFFKNLVILKLAGIDDMDAAAKLRGAELYVSREDAVPLEEGEYYIADLIGLRVVTEEGLELGTVEDIWPTGANHVITVKQKNGNEILLPYIPDCVKEVRLTEGEILIHLMEGLL